MPHATVIRILLPSALLCLILAGCASHPDVHKTPEIPSSGKFRPIDSDKSTKIYPKIKQSDGISISRIKDLADNGNVNAQLSLGKIYFDGLAGEDQDYKKAFHYFAKAANQGSPDAMYNIGICYEGGFGVPRQDPEQAIYWYHHAADRGVPDAQLKSAIYAEIQGHAEESFKYYKMLADQGEPRCMNQVALFLLNGYGTKPDPAAAVEYLRKSIQTGNTRAMVRLADCYQKGLGVQRNHVEMFHLLTVAAHDGDPEAQAKLGVCYRDGLGIPVNPEMAFHWFKISADAKYPTGQYLLGECYRKGLGTQPNEKLAYDSYLLAAQGEEGAPGDPIAQIAVAEALLNGDGVVINPDAAYDWLKKASDNGLPLAFAKFAILVAKGTPAHPADAKAAQALLDRAAASHDPAALLQTALAYLKADGIPENRDRARALLQEAATAGSPEARAVFDLYFPAAKAAANQRN